MDFCIEAAQEAIHRYGKPDIFNTDLGSQFTSVEFTQLFKDHGIAISMDGKGCWRDNMFVERLWKSIKSEEVYLHAYETVSAAKSGIGRYLDFYNSHRPHSALDGRTLLPCAWGGERRRGSCPTKRGHLCFQSVSYLFPNQSASDPGTSV